MKEIDVYNKLNDLLKTALRKTTNNKSKRWLSQRKLNEQTLDLGYYSGQLHYRKSEEFKIALLKIGLIDQMTSATDDEKANYLSITGQSISFPLRDQSGNIVNFFFQEVDTNEHLYLNNSGVYPEYPDVKTQRLFVTLNEVSCASLLSRALLDKTDAVISLRDGEFTKCIEDAIDRIEELVDVILIE